MHNTKDMLLSLCNQENPIINVPALHQLVDDRDDEVRLLVAELLAYDQSEQTKAVLLSLLQRDRDELVRAEAADSLACFESQELLAPLLTAFYKDPSDIVKGYILQAVCDIANCFDSRRIYDNMEQIFADKHSFRVRAICAAYLYRHGKPEMLAFLQEGLESSDFYIRKWAAQGLEEIKEVTP